MDILAILNFTAAIQGLFLAYFLLKNRFQSLEYRTLAALLIAMSIALLGAVLGLSGYYKKFPHLIRVGEPFVLLFGPLLYFCIHIATRARLPKGYLWHLLPFALYTLSLIPFYGKGGQEKVAYVDNVFFSKTPGLYTTPFRLFRIFLVGLYVVLSLKLIKNFQHGLKARFSSIEKISLNRSEYLLKLIAFILSLSIIIYLAGEFWELNLIITNNLVGLAISIVIYAIAYDQWNRPAVTVLDEELERRTFNLSDHQLDDIARRLERLMLVDKIFLQSELSLAELSQKLGVQQYQASEVINRKFQEPFFDLINRYRVEEVKQKLRDPAFNHFSILGIAIDCGFNSKSSFNAAFRKFTGTTPSEFRRN